MPLFNPTKFHQSACLVFITLILTIAASPTRSETNNAALADAASQTEVHFDLEKLPEKARETLNRIKAAARSGDIEEI